MKKFIIKILLMLGVTFVAFFFVDIHISKYLRSYSDRRFKGWNDFYNNKLNNDVVIIGSSRAWAQYNPSILDSILRIDSYNLGIDGSKINRQIIKYYTYCRMQNRIPKFIIQNIDFNTIGITKGYEREQFFPYFHYDRILFNEINQYEKFNFFEKFIPCFRYIGHSDLNQNSFGINIVDGLTLNKGYHGNDWIWNGEQLELQDSVFYLNDKKALKLFDDYLCDVAGRGVKVLFVYAPLYIGATEKIVNIEGMYEMYDTIAKKYNIPILDYNYDAICYDTNYFYNAMHLNKKGSELFSIKLAHDIDSLGILK